MRYHGSILVSALLVLLISGCVVTEKIVQQPQDSGRQLEIVHPARQRIDPQRLAPDVKLVAAALIEKMRGDRSPVDGVVFAPNGLHEVTEADFKYEGFDLKLFDIIGYEPKTLGKHRIEVLAAGLLHFEDPIGRRASAYFSVRYTVGAERIIIEESAAAIVPPVYPRLEAYFVPQSEFANLQEGDLADFTDFYLFTRLLAVPMAATEEEKKAREAYEKLSLWKKVAAGAKEGTADYFIIVFCMDRLAADATLEMNISNTAGMAGQDLAEALYRYDNGWRTMIAGGRFNPDSPSTHFYANVQYVQDPQSASEPILIGSFKNEKNYAPRQPPKQLAQHQGDAIASGNRFLNPENPQDAIQIQNRLRELGFYQGEPDGKFGERSRSALSNFAAAAGIQGESIWTLAVQRKLFAEAVTLKAGPISSGRKLLNPAIKSDAKLIQTRLKTLGHYSGNIDGLFGKGSYRALENFYLDAGLPGSSRWDLQTQGELFKGTGM